jgi:hypothetical protein
MSDYLEKLPQDDARVVRKCFSDVVKRLHDYGFVIDPNVSTEARHALGDDLQMALAHFIHEGHRPEFPPAD